MQYVETEYYLKQIPETQDDIEYLRKEFPHLGNFEAVTIPKTWCGFCGTHYTWWMTNKHECDPDKVIAILR